MMTMVFRVTLDTDGRTFEARPDETLLQAGRRAGVILPFECGWGSCATCKATLVDGEVELLFPEASAISPRDARRNRVVVCQAMARSDLLLKPMANWEAGPGPKCVEQQAELIEVEQLAPDIRRFVFEPEQNADFLPGQYLIVHLGDNLRRAYSMCNLPDGKSMQIISKRYEGGVGSNTLAKLTPGARVTIEAPFGTCTLKRKPGRTIFVAGGTGISPILSLVRQAANEGLNFKDPVDVIYGARSPDDLAAGEQLAEATSKISGATYRPVVEQGGDEWAGARGRAPELIASLAFDPQNTMFYVAGPPVMVNAVKAQLKETGVPLTHVHYDSFG